MRRIAAISVPLAIVFALTLWRARGVDPRDAGISPEEFSAARARVVLQDLVGDGKPHPTGTLANTRVRDRIVEKFRDLGYVTTVHRRFACNAAASCGTVDNIVATEAGARGSAVLLVSHYDSVPAGPGASDDAMGTAALLEIARALHGRPLRNPFTFLITDGEEAGLLGAEAFASDALMRDAAVVINVENRGTDGASNMFETSSGNRWIARKLADALPHPQASSFFFEIYNLLPNDTDVTVFRREGKAAVNFAAIGGVTRYHTPLDDFGHASMRTLQHHGENLLATARAFGDADLDARSSTDATYFDVLGFTLVWWPQEWTLWIAVVSLLLLVAAARNVSSREMTFGVISAFVAILVTVAGGFALGWLTRLRSTGMNWVAHPVPSIAAMWLTGLAAALFAAALFRHRSKPLPMLYGVAIVWHAIAIALAVKLAGVAYMFLVPAVAVTVCALLRRRETFTTALAATAAAVLLFPLGVMIYDALGGRLLIAPAIVIGIVSTLIAPLFGEMRAAIVTASLAVACAVLAVALPATSEATRQRLNIAYVDDPAAGGPQWIATALTDPLRQSAKFSLAASSATPWDASPVFAAPAPPFQLARPVITQEPIEGGVRVHVRSLRNADRLMLRFRGGTVLRVNGLALPPKPRRFRAQNTDWKSASVTPADELVVDIATTGIRDLVASDVTYGLPASGAALQRARDRSMAIASQDGDVTIARTRLK